MFLARTNKEMDRIKIRKRNGGDFGLIRSSAKAAYFNTSKGFIFFRPIDWCNLITGPVSRI